jgi:hypothetical protein
LFEPEVLEESHGGGRMARKWVHSKELDCRELFRWR